MSPHNDIEPCDDHRWLPLSIDWAQETLLFAWLERSDHAKVTFLTEEYLRALHPPVRSVPLGQLATAASAAAPHYVFHSAFCCSTLLVRALDVPGVVMGLSEPQIVNELAGAALQRRLTGDLLKTVVGLLGRPFGPGESVVVKPGNEANLLAPALLETDERSRAIFLYAPLPRFLKSVASKGMWGRIWGRRLYSSLSRRSSGGDLGLSEAERFELTDLQAAALAWLLHHAEAADLLARFPARVRTLDSTIFLARHAETLAAVARHFALDADERQWQGVAEGPVFKSHSKELGRGFSPEEASDPGPVMPAVAEEIAMVDTWARAVAQNAGLLFDLPPESALVGPA
ncbi:MAG: hypothetical protein ACJ8D5_07525 [Sphingomicrobium sp.]